MKNQLWNVSKQKIIGISTLLIVGVLANLVFYALGAPPSLRSAAAPATGAVTTTNPSAVASALADGAATLLLHAAALVVADSGGTTALTAIVRDETGQPVAGAPVAFSATGGTVDPASAVTDESGMATANFRAGSALGQAVIAASVESASGTLQQSVAVEVANLADVATAHTVQLSIGATELDPGGQTGIAAQLLDATGRPVPGAVISFFGALGQVSPASAVTDADGRAGVSFTAGNAGGAARISALSGYAAASDLLVVRGAEPNDPSDPTDPNDPNDPSDPTDPSAQSPVYLPLIRR